MVALGGGGVRGVAHLGVLDCLDAAGVRIRGIAGTSSGALMGALWITRGRAAVDVVHEFIATGGPAALPDLCQDGGRQGWAGRQVNRFRLAWALANLAISRHRVSLSEYMERMGRLVPDIPLNTLAIPFAAVGTDSSTGEEVQMSEGSLRLAVSASAAMPGLVAPVPWRGRRIQDGGAVAEIPVAAARSLGSPVLAVEVSEGLPPGDPDRDRFHRAMFRAAAMGWQALRGRLLAEADAVISPKVNHLHWAQFGAVNEAYAAGFSAAEEWLASLPRRASPDRPHTREVADL